MTGRTILHYIIGEQLGAGGMGAVYRAQDTKLGRDVALKFLPASYQYDPDRRERFFREARAASALRSPNIAAIYDIGEYDGSSFIVMEFVEGATLSTMVGRGPLPVSEAINIALQIADALDEAHAAGIVHRDIKSGNLIVTERGLVKVLDFGLAKFTGNLPGAGPNRGDSGDGRGARAWNRFVHVSGTSLRSAGRSPVGHLFSRCCYLRNADGATSLQR